MSDTRICATSSGDQTFLFWLHDRLVEVYKEDPSVDFVQTLSSFRVYFWRRSLVPPWLNWILRKYDL